MNKKSPCHGGGSSRSQRLRILTTCYHDNLLNMFLDLGESNLENTPYNVALHRFEEGGQATLDKRLILEQMRTLDL